MLVVRLRTKESQQAWFSPKIIAPPPQRGLRQIRKAIKSVLRDGAGGEPTATVAWNSSWVSQFGMQNPEADNDNDGLSNYDEMLAGTDPGERDQSGNSTFIYPATPIVEVQHETVEDISRNLVEIAKNELDATAAREMALIRKAEKMGIR